MALIIRLAVLATELEPARQGGIDATPADDHQK
jgi:hypothetical protein